MCARTCEQTHSVDLAELARLRALKRGGASFRWTRSNCATAVAIVVPRTGGVTLHYAKPESGVRLEAFVGFAYTRTPFGGQRQWFACPGCGKPCRILYVPGTVVCCRRCARLAYESQGESPTWRAARQAQRIRKRLGVGSASVSVPFPRKPRRMRWKTYRSLEERHRRLIAAWCGGVGEMIDRLHSRAGASG